MLAGGRSAPGDGGLGQVPADRIAVTLQLAVAPQVAGNVNRNDQVSVFCSWDWQDSSKTVWQTYVIVPRVRVLSIGEAALPSAAPSVSAQPSATSTSAAPVATSGSSTALQRYVVTLALYQDEAERVVNCAHGGFPYLGVDGAKASISGPPPSYDQLFATPEGTASP